MAEHQNNNNINHDRRPDTGFPHATTNPNDKRHPRHSWICAICFDNAKQQKDGRDQSDMVTAHRQEVGQTQLAKGFCDFVFNGLSFPTKHPRIN